MAQLLLTIDFMRHKGVIHRDLKPENILLNSKKKGIFDIRIADFGLSALAEDPLEKNKRIVCGTAGYIPPEVLMGQKYTFKSDIFSAGSIMYTLFTNNSLFQGNDYESIMKANKECDIRHVDSNMSKFSHAASILLKSLLNPDHNVRPFASEGLQFVWFKN